MKKTSIYLRSIKIDGKNHLAMYDSNGDGGIDDLVTTTPRGSKVEWTTDSNSGIKKITKIYSKSGKRNVFKKDPAKKFLSNALEMDIEKDAEGEEAYAIDYILNDGTKNSIDPVIKIPPPKP